MYLFQVANWLAGAGPGLKIRDDHAFPASISDPSTRADNKFYFHFCAPREATLDLRYEHILIASLGLIKSIELFWH